jgi:hypothetical protein
MPSLLINDEKIEDSKNVADVFNSFSSIAENLNLHQVGKDDPVSFERCISLQIPFY